MFNYIKNIGLWLFIIGFGVFVISLSLSDYKLTKTIVQGQGDGEKYDALQKATQPMIGVEYGSNVSFIQDLRGSINRANESLIEKYSIDPALAEQIASKSAEEGQFVFRQTIIDELIQDKGAVAAYQIKGLKDYAGWLEGKSFNNRRDLARELQKVMASFNNSLSYQKAFDDYATGTLVFSMTKASSMGILTGNLKLSFFLSFGLIILGAFIYFYGTYANMPPGIKNNHIFMDAMTSKGWLGVALGTFMIAFYVFLYFFPEYLTNWVLLVDPISYALNGGPASRWFLYGFLYTLAVFVMGIRMILKCRHNTYQIMRTISVIFFQTALAFIIPEILIALNKPGYDFKNIWPLDYDFFYGYNLESLMRNRLVMYMPFSAWYDSGFTRGLLLPFFR
jgi:ferredoxin-type protein NapH